MSIEKLNQELPMKDFFDAKSKNDILLNITAEDKKRLINLNSWSVKAIELSILERLEKRYLKVNQGEIWSVDFGENVGTEMNNIRPCIIISDNVFNNTNLVTVIPITNNITSYPTQVSVEELGLGEFLTGTSKTEQIKTISKARLGKKIPDVSLDEKGVFLLQKALFNLLGIKPEYISIMDKLQCNPEAMEQVLDLLNK